MAISNVAIANRALQKLGAGRISSLTQDNPNARSINAMFESVRDMELRRYDWSFAIKRASIAADATDETILSTWKRYSLPNDYIKLLRDNESGTHVDWKIEGRYILSADASPLEIRYIARIEDPNLFDSLFVEVFAGRMAIEGCEEITQSVSKLDSVTAAYDKDISEAKRIGAIEKPAQEPPEDPWLTAMR